MKLYPSFRYQLHDQRNAILVYYGIVVVMVFLGLLSLPFSGNANMVVLSGGITAVTMVFSFVLSLCVFKDSFLMNLQHGVSRRSQFLARLGAMGAVCAAMAVADEVYTLVCKLFEYVFPNHFFSRSLYEMLYAMREFSSDTEAAYRSTVTSPATVLGSIMFSFFALLAVNAFAYLISVFNFRLNKAGKILFWVGWPFLFIAIDAFLSRNPALALAVERGFVSVSSLCFSTLPRMALTCTLLTALFSGLTWLLMRRAAAK